ncbi:MAG: NAD(P)-dependent oxidoreductase [Geminicoccaceae bacterium]|jgi:uronate dehydrogenase|nr:NAD(P)-dependent oxidoreductase [Geminicoccaceae bacterium]
MRVLMTGAAGGVATMLRPLLVGLYDEVVLSDRRAPEGLAAHERFVAADLGDPDSLAAACDGVDGIIHLGGQAYEAEWEVIHSANITGCWNLFEAARQAGVERVVFASSNHAIGFYPRRDRIGVDEPVRPDSRYGISKAFGEAVGSFYADKFGLRVLSIRIGNVGPVPLDKRRLSIWIHQEDLLSLIRIGLEHPELHNAIVYGVSQNERSWWDNRTAHRLGYAPRHRAEDHVDAALAAQAKLPPDPIGDLFQGGTFCAAEFAGDLKRTSS